MKIILIVLLLLILFLTLASYRCNQVDSHFLKFITNKDILICGNSPNYYDQINKVNINSNTVITRFNNVMDHIPKNSRTDIIILNSARYYPFLFFKYNKYKKEQSLKYVFWAKQFKKYRETIFKNNGIKVPTSGMIFLYFIIKHIDLVNSVTLVGFNLYLNGNIVSNRKVSKEHDVENETKLLNKFVEQNPKIVLIK